MEIAFESVEIEIPCTRNGKQTYRLGNGLFVIVDGRKLYPPMPVREAKRFARNIESGKIKLDKSDINP